MKAGKLYKIRNMKQQRPIKKSESTVMCFGIGLSQQLEENAVVCCFLACVCSGEMRNTFRK